MKGAYKNRAATKTTLRTSLVPSKMPHCTFKFCARLSDPYVKDDCASGLEVEIIKVLQHKLEFQVSKTPQNTFPRWAGIVKEIPFNFGIGSAILRQYRPG